MRTGAIRHARHVGALGRIVLCVALFGAAAEAAPQKSPARPAWLDTLAPVVTVKPASLYQTAVFTVSIAANEPARISAAVGAGAKLAPYTRPITVDQEGRTVIYFRAEDDYGNASALDSVVYVLDTRSPEFAISPPGGTFGGPVTVRVTLNEQCKLYLVTDTSQKTGREVADSFTVDRSWQGQLLAVDRAGNRKLSERLSFVIDTSRIRVRIVPDGGLYNAPPQIRFESDPQTTVLFTSDALAPVSWFQPYANVPVTVGAGTTLMRFYGKHASGRVSEVQTARFVVDTVPPRLRVEESKGRDYDTVRFVCREAATIRYATGDLFPTAESQRYELPLAVPHQGKTVISAIAIDSAGNKSEIVRWERRYDTQAPTLTLSGRGGAYNAPVTLQLSTDEPAEIFYTLDGSAPTAASQRYTGALLISKEGSTTVRAIAVDEAGNISRERGGVFQLDTKPPTVSVRIESDIRGDAYQVALAASERATIYYETGEKDPSRSSPVYSKKLSLTGGQLLKYFAVDDAGNASEVKVLDDLMKPMIAASVPSGVYLSRLGITFVLNTTAEVFWRLLPDTSWRRYGDTIKLDNEGTAVLEYFSRSSAGVESPRRRNEYFLDWTPPRVDISLKKGVRDSVTIFFECSENATIFYTVDGSNPSTSPTVRIAGNKLMTANDRISLVRGGTSKLAYYAEDAVGNQSSLAIVDLAKPRVIPNTPPGAGRVHSTFLSVAFTSVDERAQIHYARHGHVPTTDSATYTQPLLISDSDTILAFVVDASGYRGDVDTFIYLIDLPPVPQFAVSPDAPQAGAPVTFDAFRTTDHETPVAKLLFRWDFEGDGRFDSEFAHQPTVVHLFPEGGHYRTVLEVRDERGRTSVAERTVAVAGICPEGMAYVTGRKGDHFCIDQYESPNAVRRPPQTGVTWVEAKMACYRAGKRLCTPEEWEEACRGQQRTEYPYGDLYRKGRCPSEGGRAFRSGSFAGCEGEPGVRDMVGNVWEWVDGRQGDYPLLMGGSFASGASAHCGARFVSSVAAASDDTGFRCCR